MVGGKGVGGSRESRGDTVGKDMEVGESRRQKGNRRRSWWI